MAKQSDLFDRAAKCELASQNAASTERRIVFEMLRDLWITLANDSLPLTETQLAKEIATAEEIHAAAFRLGDDRAAE